MLRLIYIVCLLFMGLWVRATTVTATIESKNSAALACSPANELPPSLSITYTTTGGTKDRIMEADSAQLTLRGIPKGEIQQITLYMKSNTNAGGATILSTLGDSTWQVVSGSFKDWIKGGSYSTAFVPLTCLNSAVATDEATTLTITIKGTANSVYLQKMLVEYTAAPKQVYSVCLQWSAPNQTCHSKQLTEDSIGKGVLLPMLDSACQSVTWNDQTWHWIGWTEQLIDSTDVQPLHWEADDWYSPEKNTTLYALYTNTCRQMLAPDTTFQSGEYVLAFVSDPDTWMLTGTWDNSRMEMTPITVQHHSNHLPYWLVDTIGAPCRYMLSFTGDSVAIQHVLSNQYIGYGRNSSNCKKWSWKKGADGSLFVHATWEKDNDSNNYQGKSLRLNIDFSSGDLYADYQTIYFLEDTPYWRLFPTTNVPTQTNALYTTFPILSSISSVLGNYPSPIGSKILLNGKILILQSDKITDLTGRTL